MEYWRQECVCWISERYPTATELKRAQTELRRVAKYLWRKCIQPHWDDRRYSAISHNQWEGWRAKWSQEPSFSEWFMYTVFSVPRVTPKPYIIELRPVLPELDVTAAAEEKYLAEVEELASEIIEETLHKLC